jgi:tRNA (Thr-GGU) A37 N-methylase
MFGMRQVGVVRSPFTETLQIPKGRGAKHEAEGFIELEPEFEPGLTDNECFSHLYVIWVFFACLHRLWSFHSFHLRASWRTSSLNSISTVPPRRSYNSA